MQHWWHAVMKSMERYVTDPGGTSFKATPLSTTSTWTHNRPKLQFTHTDPQFQANNKGAKQYIVRTQEGGALYSNVTIREHRLVYGMPFGRSLNFFY